jgi:hypothetical protein
MACRASPPGRLLRINEVSLELWCADLALLKSERFLGVHNLRRLYAKSPHTATDDYGKSSNSEWSTFQLGEQIKMSTDEKERQCGKAARRASRSAGNRLDALLDLANPSI